ncbi:hypothetical protein [Streptomyces carpinensis]|uniref:Uncharacterized protein n=1 Tax=Streptomyces carpinensis TaxID=66369 RepID=A0ABV1W4R7_9ACTN|nr:hypothetical protein [Streptomyces carpinensis]
MFAGPEPHESAAGLHTELPPFHGPVEVEGSGHGVALRLPLAVRRLDASAVRQVVCTAAYTEGRDGTAEVTVRGDDGALPPAVC